MNQWNFYTTNEIKPDGWLKKQLEIQAKGLSGNLDKVWRDVRDSAWIGGEAEGWERVPYWLDGFIPLAYLLEDQDMIGRAKRYIDAILSFQKEDGWICPCKDEERETYDTWAIQLITKVLTVYYECSRDERIPMVIYRTLKNYYTMLKEEKIALSRWAEYRWYETFIAIAFLYDRFPEEWLLDFSKILKQQGKDYNELMDQWERPRNEWTFGTHIVNIAMALKYEAVSNELLGEKFKNRAEALYQHLYQYNGTPFGAFTGDECLGGLSPIHGTELCAIVEQMYSYEWLYAYTGDEKWAERLELLAFNALPATISDDMWTHQYVQLSNQIACQRFPGKSLFRTNGPEAHLFGLEPNFGCCTANFNQGWPKFILASFMHKDNTIINVVPVPVSFNDGTKSICIETEYPFRNSFRYVIESSEAFTFQIRIPSFAKNLKVNDVPTGIGTLTFDINEKEKREIRIAFDTAPYFEKRPHNLNTVKCGSLIFSVPIAYEQKMYEYEKNEVERKYPYCDYEYLPVSDWNYAFADSILTIEEKEISEVPFSSKNPPIIVKTKVKEIPWELEDGYDSVCAKVPGSRKGISNAKEIELYPYGCAKLRMTEIPFAE